MPKKYSGTDKLKRSVKSYLLSSATAGFSTSVRRSCKAIRSRLMGKVPAKPV